METQKLAELEALIKRQGEEIKELRAICRRMQMRALMPKEPWSEMSIDEFDVMSSLIHAPQWPFAVEPYLICNSTSEQDKKDRAEGIVDIIIGGKSLKDMNFLDFGCGEGHVVKHSVIYEPKLSVGYDIVESECWKSQANTMLTTNWNAVEKAGPYNAILVYDVIDHLEDKFEAIAILRKIKNVLAPEGKIFVRCHPWCSRHGTHLYHQLNKAYLHLIFNSEELKKLGLKEQNVMKVIHPLAVYGEIFREAGLNVKTKEITTAPVEQFFMNVEVIAKRIKANWSSSYEGDLANGTRFPDKQLEVQFVDYDLTA